MESEQETSDEENSRGQLVEPSDLFLFLNTLKIV